MSDFFLVPLTLVVKVAKLKAYFYFPSYGQNWEHNMCASQLKKLIFFGQFQRQFFWWILLDNFWIIFFGQFLDNFFGEIPLLVQMFWRIFEQSLDPFKKLSELWIERAYFYPYDWNWNMLWILVTCTALRQGQLSINQGESEEVKLGKFCPPKIEQVLRPILKSNRSPGDFSASARQSVGQSTCTKRKLRFY